MEATALEPSKNNDYFEYSIIFGKNQNQILHQAKPCIKWDNREKAQSAINNFRHLNQLGGAIYFHEDSTSITFAGSTIDRSPWADNIEFRLITNSMSACKNKIVTLDKKSRSIAKTFFQKKR